MRSWVTVPMVALVGLSAGCIKTATTMHVKKDGSGTIKLEMHMSEEAMQKAAVMMAGIMAQTMGKMTGGEGEMDMAPPPEMKMNAPKSLYDETKARALASKFGEGVRFVKGKETTNAEGWKGFTAEYAFDDVNRITLGPDVVQGMAGMIVAQPGPAETTRERTAYRFSMTRGAPNTLSITYPRLPDSDAEKPGTTELTVPSTTEDRVAEIMKGRRDVILVSVEGRITTTDARWRSKRSPNTIMLYLLDYDKLLADPAARKKIEEVDNPLALADAKLPGLYVEQPGRLITVKFQ